MLHVACGCASYLGRQREHFLKGITPPDFPLIRTQPFSMEFSELSTIGLQQMGLKRFVIQPRAPTVGRQNVYSHGTRIGGVGVREQRAIRPQRVEGRQHTRAWAVLRCV